MRVNQQEFMYHRDIKYLKYADTFQITILKKHCAKHNVRSQDFVRKGGEGAGVKKTALGQFAVKNEKKKT